MKRFLLFLVALVITSVCFAQDVIVKKDGSTIMAKVLKVTQSEVEYKKFDNQNGPTYTIATKDLQCINYENGSKDTFVSENYNPSIVTNETATQYSNDNDLLALYNNQHKKIKKIVTPEMKYKRGKRMKIAGYAVGGTLIVGGIASIIVGAILEKYEGSRIYADYNRITDYRYYNVTKRYFFYAGFGAMAGGVAVGVPLILKGSSLQRKYGKQIHATSVISKDINFSNGSCLNLGVDLLSDNLSFAKTPGLGVRYNF